MPMTTEWGRSTYCGSASCVETRQGPKWTTSTRSGGNGCVEVKTAHTIHVRDSKTDQSPILEFEPDQWRHFINAIRGGEFQPTSSGN